MSAYARRLAAYERSRDILAARLWTMDAALPRTREAIFLAHNWIGCRVEHPAHDAYQRAVERDAERCEAIHIVWGAR